MCHQYRRFLAGLLLTASCFAWASPTPAAKTRLPPDGSPNLWLAAYQGDTETIGQLLAQGAAIDEPDPNDTAPLIYALRQRQYAATELLLTRGANTSAKHSGFTALSFAFWAGLDHQNKTPYDGRWLKLLLEHGADMHATTKFRPPLLTQVTTEYPPRPEALKIVLDYRPRINQRSGEQCTTALMSVLPRRSQYPEAKYQIVRMLLEAGASTNLTEITNHVVGMNRSYPTPLLLATRGFNYVDITTDDLAIRGELIDLLLKYGADPRFGGIGGRHENHQDENCQELPENGPGTSWSAATAWSDFSGSTGNPALTELLGDTAGHRAVFDRIIAAASPIAPGEVGYPALDSALASYKRVVNYIELIESDKSPSVDNQQKRVHLQARRADLEHALRTLIDLDVPLNPAHLVLPPDTNWQELWTPLTGIEHLPLFEHRMPDDIYLRLLQSGANPAIRPGDLSSRDALIKHLIRQKATSKITILNEHLGLLERVPSWCGRTVGDIGEALVRPGKAPENLAKPEGQAAKRILLKLLRNPACTARGEELRQRLPELFRQLDDPEIEQAFRQSPLAVGEAR